MKSRRPDLDLIFSGGGKPALELLEYCVRTVRMEPVFVFLVSDYRLHPSAGKALALHDVFCAPDIRFRTITWETFRAGSGMLSSTIHSVRTAVLKATAANLAAPQQRLPATLPPRHVFDSLVAELRSQKRGGFWKVRRNYDPARTPMQNLPNGKMNAGQRQFVEQIWQQVLRPHLVAAGFWRIATVA